MKDFLFWNCRTFSSPTQSVTKGGKFQKRNYFNYPESFLYCLCSSIEKTKFLPLKFNNHLRFWLSLVKNCSCLTPKEGTFLGCKEALVLRIGVAKKAKKLELTWLGVLLVPPINHREWHSSCNTQWIYNLTMYLTYKMYYNRVKVYMLKRPKRRITPAGFAFRTNKLL